jgi:glycylpeptide N-tetradecanoyltransferase
VRLVATRKGNSHRLRNHDLNWPTRRRLIRMAQSAHIEQVPDEDDVSSGSEEDRNKPESSTTQQPEASSSSKKKKKKKSKAARALASLTGSGADKIPQKLVDHVLEEAKAQHPEQAHQMNEDEVRRAMELLKVMDVFEGKSGLGGKNKKDVGEHKVPLLYHCPLTR